MNASASTAPDVMYEDTFLVNSDVAAGYLAPLNSYVSKWSGWKEFSPAAQAAAKGADGQIYGVSMGTDTRGLYYNKVVFAKAGLPVPWHPTTWAQVLAAAAKIKATEPGVTPMNVYGGTGQGEGFHHAGLRDVPVRDEQLAVGQRSLQVGAGRSWLRGCARGIRSRSTTRTTWARRCKQPSGPPPGRPYSNAMPTNKLGIDLDGSWVVGDYIPGGRQTVAGLYQGPGRSPYAHRERPGPRAREHVRGMAAVGWLSRRQQADGLQLHHYRTGPAELALVRHPRLADRQPR